MNIRLIAVLIGLACSSTETLVGGDDLPFSLSIRPRQERVLALHDVLLDITLTNTSSKLLTMVAFSPQEIYTVEMSGPDGEPAPMTHLGRVDGHATETMKEPGVLDMRGFPEITLLPRQAMKEVIRISSIFDMSAPGIYSVKLRRKIPEHLGKGEVESNTVNVTVTYNPVVEKYAPVGRKEP